MPCELCGHVYAQRHRINPGCWGGTYVDDDNLAWLCPNCHAAIHLLMKWYHRGAHHLSDPEDERLEGYTGDRRLWTFFNVRVKPAVIARMVAEGRWFPYRRTLPPPAKKESRRRKRR